MYNLSSKDKTKIGDYMNNELTLKKVMKETTPKRKYFQNAIMAFLFGGGISLMGQEFIFLFNDILKLDIDTSRTLMYIVVIFLASLFTGIGCFDIIGQVAGAGTFLPITGFANSLTSSAVESRSEGLIFGILSNMFKLAGTVIVAGVVSAFVVANILYWVRL